MTAAQLFIPAAQAQNQAPAAPEQSNRAADLSDQKLDATAAALEQVAVLMREYHQRLQTADASERPQIAEEGKSALKKAIEDQGLTIDEYNSIIVVAQNDPAVRDKILHRLHPPSEEKE
ncbi:MAG TPA: DUF4168 domain-containing protein [Xanthobacteraceae bacterium]|jgi:hypothetical protein